jgi:hypothetical protein
MKIWILSVAGVLAALGLLGWLGVGRDDAKAVATGLGALGAAVAVWATYKAVEEWDDPAKQGKERLTSWGKFAIVLFTAAGILATLAEVRGDPAIRKLQEEQARLQRRTDSVLTAELNLLRAELRRSRVADTTVAKQRDSAR